MPDLLALPALAGHLIGTIRGPEGTPYEGGSFQVDIELSIHYPFAPPKMKFITKVYHPNISSQTGGGSESRGRAGQRPVVR